MTNPDQSGWGRMTDEQVEFINRTPAPKVPFGLSARSRRRVLGFGQRVEILGMFLETLGRCLVRVANL